MLGERPRLDPIQEWEAVAAQQQLVQLVLLSGSEDEQARRGAEETLAGFSDAECLEMLAATTLEEPLARSFLNPAHFRPALAPLLLGHPDTPDDAINSLAAAAGPDIVPAFLDQLDLLKTPALLALKENPTYLLWQKEPPPQGFVIEVDLLDLLIEEMETEQPLSVEEVEARLADVEATAEEKEARGGLVSKVARMRVAQRVKLALLGTREERGLLIRDPSRVVFRAVLGSPKLTDVEVEGFATMKNVSQEVLRLISIGRKFMKNSVVLRTLVNNPRTRIAVPLPLLNRLLPNDLRAAAGSRDIPDTLRKMSQKLLKARHQ